MNADKIINQVKRAKISSKNLSLLSAKAKNDILFAMAQGLSENKKIILARNEVDIIAAKTSGISPAMIDRLTLNDKRIDDMIKGIEMIAALPDPIGSVIDEFNSSPDISIKKIRVPIGVIAMIYESRPNVGIDAAALCIKSGNSVILKGGSESFNSNSILINIICEAAMRKGLPEGAVQFIHSTDRRAVDEILKLDDLIDLIIPRGGQELVSFVRKNSLIPVLSHGKGLCHLYVDKEADVSSAVKLAINAKCQRPSVCNAIETLLVHKDIADKFLPTMRAEFSKRGVLIKGDAETTRLLQYGLEIEQAQESDWSTEYNDLIISIKVVGSIDEAIEHINTFGSKHTDAIATKDKTAAEKFIAEVDSSAVMANASTRLHDGNVFGLGGEIGISTQKLHARGVMGLKELTTTKYILYGNSSIREN
jgi:glutamate-5-semialdehyde dehydrogenase